MPAIELTGDGVSEPFDFEVRSDQRLAQPLAAAAFPVAITFTQLGPHVVVDATPQEEACATGRLHVAINPAGSVCGMQMGGTGGLHPATLLDLTRRAQVLGLNLL